MNVGVCAAIRLRAVVQFYYNGGIRTVEPYCHGTITTGHEVLRGFQTAGYSEPNTAPAGWRLFEVTQITTLRHTGETFSTNRPGYNPRDPDMRSVHCHV